MGTFQGYGYSLIFPRSSLHTLMPPRGLVQFSLLVKKLSMIFLSNSNIISYLMCKINNLRENPFSQYSAEEELDFLKEIYYRPHYYDELKTNATNGSTRILVGQRGQGKSATIHVLFEDLKNNSTLPLLITRYDGVPLSNNEAFFLYLILRALTNGIAKHVFEHENSIKKLSKIQKKRLSFYIELFYDAETAEEYIEKAKTIRGKKRWNRLIRIFNRHLKLINKIADGIVKMSSDLVRNSIGLYIPESEISDVAHEYFGTVKLKEINSKSMHEVVAIEKGKLIKMLNQLIEIANGIGYESIVIFFDKMDEFKEVATDINRVADFTADILSDTDLLYTRHLSIIFSLWSEVKRKLNSRVRFDKFKNIDIEWRQDELERIIDRRLFYYSNDKRRPVTMESLLPDESQRRQVLELADKSPRSLIRLMGDLYNSEVGDNVMSFSLNAITKGLMDFCVNFDYESMQPSKVDNKKNYYTWLEKVLSIKKTNISVDDIAAEFSVTMKVATRHMTEIEKLGIVEKTLYMNDKGSPIFDVKDPRLRFLISRGIMKLK